MRVIRKFVSKNFDFATGMRADTIDVNYLAKRYDFIGGQECFTTNFHQVLVNRGNWKVMQLGLRAGNEPLAGSLQAWREDRLHHSLWGYFVGVDPSKHPNIQSDIRTRYWLWGDYKIALPGRDWTRRIYTGHFPPDRDKELSPFMALSLIKHARQSPHPVWINADWNTHDRDPWGVAKALNLKVHMIGIDGWMVDRNTRVLRTIKEPLGHSDHHGVGIKVLIR